MHTIRRSSAILLKTPQHCLLGFLDSVWINSQNFLPLSVPITEFLISSSVTSGTQLHRIFLPKFFSISFIAHCVFGWFIEEIHCESHSICKFCDSVGENVGISMERNFWKASTKLIHSLKIAFEVTSLSLASFWLRSGRMKNALPHCTNVWKKKVNKLMFRRNT